MILVSFLLIYLAVKKQYEPLVLLPIAVGMLLVNLYPAIAMGGQTQYIPVAEYLKDHPGDTVTYARVMIDGVECFAKPEQVGGLLTEDPHLIAPAHPF